MDFFLQHPPVFVFFLFCFFVFAEKINEMEENFKKGDLKTV